MPLFSILPRVFLILVLILNGAGNTYASVGMALGAGHHQASSTDTDEEQVAMLPCSDHQAAMLVGSETAAGENAAPALPPDDQHGSPDCCDPLHCKCPCVHACTALPVVASKMLTDFGHDASVRRLQPEHPSPALPHLIRPPIG